MERVIVKYEIDCILSLNYNQTKISFSISILIRNTLLILMSNSILYCKLIKFIVDEIALNQMLLHCKFITLKCK